MLSLPIVAQDLAVVTLDALPTPSTFPLNYGLCVAVTRIVCGL